MHLTITDFQSNTWIKLKDYYTKRLQDLRQKNDGDMDVDQRQKHLGRIAEVKILLAMDSTPVQVEM